MNDRFGRKLAAGLLCFLGAALAPSWAADADPVAGCWAGEGNGPAHTGYYPATIGTEPFTPGWTKTFEAPINSIAIAEGKVFVTSQGDGPLALAAQALDAETGEVRWSDDLSGELHITAPTYAAGRVYFQRETPGIAPTVRAVAAETGALAFDQPYSSRSQLHLAPIVADGTLWAAGGSDGGGLYGYDANTGVERFLSAEYSDGTNNAWAPGAADGVVYTWRGNTLRAFDPVNGALLWTFNDPWGPGEAAGAEVPVISGGRVFALGSQGLLAIDLASHSLAWSSTGEYFGRPALDGDAVYLISHYLAVGSTSVVPHSILHAYAVASGQEIGTCDVQDTLQGPPLITQDLIIVAGDSSTYILDKSQFSQLQKLNAGGDLSFASGTLYVTTKRSGQNQGMISTFRVADSSPEADSSPSAPITPPTSPATVFPSGTFSGELIRPSGHRFRDTSFVKIMVDPTGHYKGTVQRGGLKVALRGVFGLNGRADEAVRFAPQDKATVRLDYNGQVSPAFVNATIDPANAEADVGRLYPQVPTQDGGNAALAGGYTMLFTQDMGAHTVNPGSSGFGTLSLYPNGMAQLQIILPNGSSVFVVSHFSADRTISFYRSMYASGGGLEGKITFADADQSDFTGFFRWIKPMTSRAEPYPDAGSAEMSVIGSRYVRREHALVTSPEEPTATMSFLGDAISWTPYYVDLKFTGKEARFAHDFRSVVVHVHNGSGLVTGHYLLQSGMPNYPLRGVIYQKTNVAAGLFFDGHFGGFTISPVLD